MRKNAEVIRSIRIAASARWQEAQRKPRSDRASGVKLVTRMAVDRTRNFATRESLRSSIDFTRDIALERKIGSTMDIDRFPPNQEMRQVGRAVARIVETAQGTEPRGFGTGFLISKTLLITNHHVFRDQTDVEGCAANFLYEYGDDDRLKLGLLFRFRPDRFFITNQALDYTILSVETVADDKVTTLDSLPFLPLIGVRGKIVEGSPVSIIQYPDGGPKQYAFKNSNVTLIDDASGMTQYSTDTMEGSSGSPVFNHAFEVALIHHSGVPFRNADGTLVTTNGKPADKDTPDEEILWVANEGISISRIVSDLKSRRTDHPDQSQTLMELLTTTGDSLMTEVRTVHANNNSATVSSLMQGTTGVPVVMNFSGPVNIYINSTAAVQTTSLTGIQSTVEADEFEKKLVFDENYDDRHLVGYDPKFLGIVVPTPTITQERADEIYAPGGHALILNYHHYALVMNRKRRMAMWTAANVSYEPSMRDNRGRKEFGDESKAWRADPRIPSSIQILNEEFYAPAKNVDRGHLVRRSDLCWGKTAREITFANSDSFHYTNCTPQHEAFNQSIRSGSLENWGTLENLLQEEIGKQGVERACVFAGPVLDNRNDPRATEVDIQYPLKFWKIAIIAEEGKLLAYGFVLDQSRQVDKFGLGFEELALPQFKFAQRSIQEISDLSGVLFDQAIYDADTI